MEDSYLIVSCVTVLFGLFLRCCISLNSYSGANTPPVFGDYEAQRHWMEITHNLPAAEWYKQSASNDLQYWGLDYPPLTAYHSKLCGYIASLINPDWVTLTSSRGFESYDHKLFMRYTVLAVDLLIYIPAVLYFFKLVLSESSKQKQLLVSSLILSYPGLILIDHGHFQYNCVSLGFALYAIIFILKDIHEVGSMFFVLALNYKQMELYHAFPFFFYLLGISYKQKSWCNSIKKLTGIGTTVIVSFALCWLPFLNNIDTLLSVLHRLFPFARGVFEDKVANFWCSLSVVIKVKNIFTQDQILKLCLVTTLVACIPSCLNLFRFPTKKKFLYSLTNCSLAFFLFSFQVHEKSIIIVALPVCLVLLDAPLASVWFLIISVISMYPLLVRDGQSVSYFALLAIFSMMAFVLIDVSKYNDMVKVAVTLSLCSAICIHILFAHVKAPARFPDLYRLLFAVYSCCHFLLFWFYFNFVQWSLHHHDNLLNNVFKVTKNKSN